ncbi:hypothetical protein AB0F17_10675 [Nonomuraea sp. NPDC026600]
MIGFCLDADGFFADPSEDVTVEPFPSAARVDIVALWGSDSP